MNVKNKTITTNICPKPEPNLKRLGDWGEEIATRYLQSLGCKILERSWRNSMGEIDVVASDGEEIIFTEVKTRRNNYFGYPEEAVGPRKQRTLRAMAERYLKSRGWLGHKNYRIDVIAIRQDAQGTWLKHFKNAVGG